MLRLRFALFVAVALVGGLLSFGAAQSARQQTLVIGGDWTDLITLDPGVAYEFSPVPILDNTYQRLVQFPGTDLSHVVPDAATSWDIASTPDGGTTITFHLADATFSTGRPLTAQDVVWSFDRVIHINGPSAFLFTDVAGLKVGSTKALDDKTVQLTLPKGVNPQIVLAMLTFNIGGIMDATEVQKHIQGNDYGQHWLNDHSAGSGPYMLDRWDRGSQVVLVTNPKYPNPPSIKRVILRYMQESNAQRAALTSGEIDIAYNFTPDAFKQAEQNPDLKTYKTGTFVMQYLGMNSGPGAPFADNRVRDAVRYAIDQDGIISNLLGGLGRKMQTIIPYGLLGADTTVYYQHDIEKAKQLMAEAGKAGGMQVEFLIPTGACGGGVPCADLAATVQSDLAKIGITANIKQTTSAQLYTIYRQQAAQLVLAQWSPDYPDPNGNASPLADFNAKSLAWRNVWNDPHATQLVNEAATSTDPAQRKAIYAQLTKYVAQNGPFAILYQPVYPIVSTAKVDGFARSAQGDVDYTAITKQP
jgi:peptide/nickel transport system substrate-binding protein